MKAINKISVGAESNLQSSLMHGGPAFPVCKPGSNEDAKSNSGRVSDGPDAA